MSAVIKINVVWCFVDFHPFDWLASLVGFDHLLQLWTSRLDVTFAWSMAIEAGLIGWHIRVTGTLDERMTISTIETELASVHFV